MVMNGNAETVTLLLPETLDLAASENFLELVRGRVNGDTPLRMDASAVKVLTLPCAQIVLAAVRSGDDIKIKDPSAAFTEAFDDLGLDWMSCLDRSAPVEQALTDQASADQDVAEQGPAEIRTQEYDGQPGDAARPAADATEPQDQSGQSDLHPISESVMNTRILTIDDSKTMRDMLMLTLAGAGFDVIQAVDGQDGLDVLVDKQVDVIITDINMPRMDGYEVIRNLRRNPAHKATPILVLTTESETEKKNLAREAGATGWMVKPFDPDRLVATVRKVAPAQ
jgi:two-component system chemotaxis response regulator CheY